jgi:hypothetical protein
LTIEGKYEARASDLLEALGFLIQAAGFGSPDQDIVHGLHGLLLHVG